MPTPMPIIAMNCGANDGMLMNREARPTRKKPELSPIKAVTIGRPIATTEPKASRRMMMAAEMPMSSELPGGSRSARRTTAPSASTWKPGTDSFFTRSIKPVAAVLSTWEACLSYWTMMRAILPSFEIAPGLSNGDETPTTSGSLASLPRSASTCAVAAGSSRPPAGFTTTVTWSPAFDGKRLRSASKSCCASEPGTLNEEPYSPAASDQRTARGTRTATAPASTSGAWLCAKRGQRSNMREERLNLVTFRAWLKRA